MKNPDAYIASLVGWRRLCTQALRSTVIDTASLQESIKWGHLVYFSNGPAILIRAEENRVLFGFWRGKRLQDIEPRLKPGGKYEMATLELVEGMPLERSTVIELVRQAVALNKTLGDPTDIRSRLQPTDAINRVSIATPNREPLCPICGGPNGCVPAQTGSFAEPCWCRDIKIDPLRLALVPGPARGQSCVCRRCALPPTP